MTSQTTSPEQNALIGLANIMRRAFNGDNLSQLTSTLVNRIQHNADDAAAMLDLSIVLQLNAQPEFAMQLQAQALSLKQHFRLQSNPAAASLRLLAIMGPGEVMANTPLEFLVEDSGVALELLYLGEGLPVPTEIPEHDLAFVAVCESDQNQFLLRQLSTVVKHWPRPFINSPAQIAQLSRNAVSSTLSSGIGHIASEAHRQSRAEVHAMAGDSFPVIVRP